jgi:hypothetical protein
LQWVAGSNATGFDIYQGVVPGNVSSTPVQQNVPVAAASISGLQFGQTYVFAVAAVTSNGVSPLSIPVDVTIVPAAPTATTSTSPSAGTLVISWAKSSGANDYGVYQGTQPILSQVTAQSVTFNGLTAGAQYSFLIYAQNAGGRSEPAMLTGSVAPAAPTAVSTTPANGVVSVSWGAVNGATGYQVFMGTTSGGESSQAVETGPGTTATITGLTNGTKYFFTVVAVNSGGKSPASAEASATPIGPASSGGGGGTLDWLTLTVLMTLVGFLRTSPFRFRNRS